MTSPPDLSRLSHAEKDALILSLFALLSQAHEKIAALEARADARAGISLIEGINRATSRDSVIFGRRLRMP